MAKRKVTLVMRIPFGLSLCTAFFGAALLWGCVASSLGAEPTEARADGDEFFEREIRPLLIESCGKCHGPEKQWAGLRVDSRDALLRGGDTGPAIVPGKPEESLLIEAVRQTGDLKMPPKSQLKEPQVAALERWIKQGAHWPATNTAAASRSAAQHWAFQPIRSPEPPAVSKGELVSTPIDAFLLERLERQALSFSTPADRRTLIRRVTYDLTGLPPTPEAVEAFVTDSSADAYPRLIDRLLDSPQYGEHWARRWLDLARYSDTKGYVYGREERFYVHAAGYRDWVVEAFNSDLPYDRFLLLQIAADQLPASDRKDLAALGFFTIGRRFLGVTHDIIDDRIDVVTRGTMGLTVACARCHDHKYDPIPTADYYSLYGVFQNCCERTVEISPLPATSEAEAAFVKELQVRQQKLADALVAARATTATHIRTRLADYLFAQRELEKYPEEGFDQVLSKDDLIPDNVRHWQAYLARAARKQDPAFAYWTALVKLPAEGFAEQAAKVCQELKSLPPEASNVRMARAFETAPATPQELAERYARVLTEVDQEWQTACKTAHDAGMIPPAALPDPDSEALRQVLYAADSPGVVPDEPIASSEYFFTTDLRTELWRLQGEVDRWLLQAPNSGTHALVLDDRQVLREPRIFKRGNPATKGDEISRHFLTLLSGGEPRPFTRGSGRLELAQAIVSPENPLTARVWVNRIWTQHFGAGLVRTPSDFGIRAEAPTHPELLDWLAQSLVKNGWSTKSLHRLILLSAAYRQSSAGPTDEALRKQALHVDADNKLLWRMNAHRLSFEEFRDTLLAVSGELDGKVGGKPAELFPASGFNRRRTLYGLVDRQFLPGVLRMFDFANPDMHIPLRAETTVPQQALFGMNHPFVAHLARSLTSRPVVAGLERPEERIRVLYRAVYQREATSGQVQAALEFIEAATPVKKPPERSLAADWQYGFGEWSQASDRLQGFTKLPHFNGAAWQGGPAWPDPQLGWVQLTAQGGHAGNDLLHAAVRRWTAPRDGTVSIESKAIHDVAAGDGIHCRIVSSRQGTLAEGALHNAERQFDVAAVEVKAGDTLDFVVDFAANLNSDQFLWAPRVRETALSGTGTPEAWDAAQDFVGGATAQLSPWEQLAQVLLLSNELMFVD